MQALEQPRHAVLRGPPPAAENAAVDARVHVADHIRFHFRTGQLWTAYATMNFSDAAWQQLISALHASGRKAALAITGGGSGAVGELLRVPGGSRLLIEAQVPYDEQALAAFLGFAPAQACSSETAIAIAQSARARAARLLPPDAKRATDLVGLGA